MAYFSMQNVTRTENLQDIDDNQSALDKVVDPCTEFQYKTSNVSPSEAFNLPVRKYSLPIRPKLSYKVENELPRVHRNSRSQSVVKMLKKNIQRQSSESSEFGSDKTILSSTSNRENLENVDVISNDSLIYPTYYQDRLETASNISLTSNLTDAPGSNISSTSDLTGYEEELFQIKKLLIHGSCQSLYQPEITNTKLNVSSIVLEQKIEELQSQLQEALAENEKYKFDLNDLENRIELVWQEKYQDALRQKAQCEGQLENIRKQYDNSLNEKEIILQNSKYSNALKTELSKLQLKLNNLEKQNSDFNSKLLLSSNESKQWQTEYVKTESENEKLRINLQEMKSEIDSKNSVLFGLKNKITEQHIEIQNQVQTKLKLNNQITTLNNEIESVKKSEKWYIEQLHNCQLTKNNIQQELMSTQTNLISEVQKVEKLKMEIVYWKNMCDETQRKAMREKEKLLRKVEMIEADILEREAILKCTQTENETKVEMNYLAKTIEPHDSDLLQDYEEQLTNMKKVINDQTVTIENLHKQNTEYLVRLTTVQKNLNEKQLIIQTIENRNRDLEMKCNVFNENMRTKDNELLELKNKIVNLEVALHAANREKQEIDEVVRNIKEDFNKFMKCYQSMKEKLEEKSKVITQFEQEKQELFMENNWRICEIEELQHKLLEAKGLQAEIVELKNIYNEILIEKEDILKENEINITKIAELQQEIKQHSFISETKDRTNFENEILKLKEALSLREEQLLNQTKNCELLNNEIMEKEKCIQDLQISSMNFSEIQQENNSLNKKITEFNKKLLDANSVIEQFNNLCKNSETEKYNLKKQLNLLKKQLDSSVIKKQVIDASCQTDEFNSELIKSKLTQLITNKTELNEVLTELLNSNDIEEYEKSKILTAKMLKFKNKIQIKLNNLSEKCNRLDRNYQQIEKIIEKFKSTSNSVATQVDFDVKADQTRLLQEIKDLKTQLRVNEMQRKEHYKRYEANNRTLLKKVKEHMRGRKVAEKKFTNLEETYNLAITEINNTKIISNRLEVELTTFKTRCDEYKMICDKLNEDIIRLEKEKNIIAPKGENECLNCLDKSQLDKELKEFEYKYKNLEEKLNWYEKEIGDKEQGITECKKQLFNEKLQTSALKKQLSSVQMCLDNANEQLDNKQVEFGHLKSVVEKLETNEKLLTDQLENAHIQYQECKRKLETTSRLLEEKTAKDEILADEIKTLSCHLHQKTLETTNVQNKYSLLESQTSSIQKNHEKIIEELQSTVNELQTELDTVRNDKFFLQRLCADLKMSLQGTLNQNKVLKVRLESLQSNSFSSLPSPSKIDEEYINKLLQQSTVVPNKPLKNLRSCLDSLKQEMATLQREIIAKTQSDLSL